jgi:FMN phosphatase YigB (HAD superfamily)
MKPDLRAFRIFEDKAKALGMESNGFLFVGDDFVKDYQAAINAGWNAILFQPDRSMSHIKVEHSISQLHSLVNHPLVKRNKE